MSNFIQFKELTVRNFLSIGLIEKFPLDKDGIYLVLGQNLDDPKCDSNGSGKSSLFDAILWCLFGKLPRFEGKQGLADDVINEAVGKDCMVSVTLEVAGRNFTISRYRKDTIYLDKVKIYEGEVDITRHVTAREGGNNDLILEVIKTPYEIFSSTLIISQGMRNRFSELDDTQKKTLIESLRDTEYQLWIKCQTRASEGLSDCSRVIGEHDTQIAIWSGNMQFLSKRVSELSTELGKLEKTLAAGGFDDTIKGYDDQKSESERKQAFLEDKLHKVEDDLKLVEKDIEPYEEKVFDEELEKEKLESKVRDKESIIKSPEKKCSQCGTILSSLSPEKLDELNREYKELLKTLEEARTVVETQEKQLETLNARKKSLEAVRTNINSELQKVLSSVTQLVGKIETEKSSRDTLSTTILTKKAEIESNRQQIDTLYVQTDDLTKKKTKLEERKPYLQYLARDVFAPKGIRAFLVAKDINDLNRRLHMYSKILFSDQLIYLKAGVEDGNITKISLEIRGKADKKYAKLSGGEKRRVDIAMQFSLYDFIRDNFKVRFNTLVLDEIFDGLDAGGIQSTMKLISEFVRQNMAVYVISHNPAIKSLIGKTYTMTKKNGISTLG